MNIFKPFNHRNLTIKNKYYYKFEMEGTLEKFIGYSGTLFSSEEWKSYYFILHEEILLFT